MPLKVICATSVRRGWHLLSFCGFRDKALSKRILNCRSASGQSSRFNHHLRFAPLVNDRTMVCSSGPRLS